MLRFLMVYFFFVQAVSALTLDDVRQRLAADVVLRAEFVQVRQVQGLSRALRSSGELLMSRNLHLTSSAKNADTGLSASIWWHQQQPFDYTLVLTPQWFSQQLPNARPEIIRAEQQPMMFQFFTVMLGLLKADFTALSERFEIEFSSQGEQWHVKMMPRSEMIKRVFSQIDLHGKRFLEQVELLEPGGHRTQLNFSGQIIEPAVLSAEEQRYFVH